MTRLDAIRQRVEQATKGGLWDLEMIQEVAGRPRPTSSGGEWMIDLSEQGLEQLEQMWEEGASPPAPHSWS